MSLRKIGILNLLLVFVPISLALRFIDALDASALSIFTVSAIAIIPLAGLMGKSTEMLADKLGPGIGGLLNASFGNAAELIIAVFALKAGLIDVVKASITGSILGNVLLVLGASFFAGGIRYKRQTFNATAAGMSSTLLVIAVVGLLVPGIFHAHLMIHDKQGAEQDVSLEISVVLFAVYILMLVFSLKTHKHLYSGDIDETEESDPGGRRGTEHAAHYSELEGAWTLRVSIIVLLVATAFVTLMSESLVGAIEETSEALNWSQFFVGVIVVAIIGNAAEHSTAILVAAKNHMDLAFHIAVGSGLQIALFVAPLLVFISYLPIFEHRLDLVFSMFEIAAVSISALIVGLVAYDGESNWFEGLLLLAVYLILGIAFYHLPV